MVYTILKHAHSGFRWFLLGFLLFAILSAIYKLVTKKQYSNLDKKNGLLAMSFAHLQLLGGLILYFISSKVIFSVESMSNAMLRFFLVEHISLMVIAVILLTIGYSKAKKANNSEKKLKTTLVFYGIALLVILLAIPWPWQNFAASWF